MCILFYSAMENDSRVKYERAVKEFIGNKEVEVHHSLVSLSKSLYRACIGGQIAVLCAVSREELSDFVSIRDLLEKVRLVLVLPDRDKETLREGLKLYPRFWDYVDGDFTVVTAVLNKMVKQA